MYSIILLFLLALAPQHILANEDGKNDSVKTQYLTEQRELALRGDTDAMYNLGVIYYKGLGVPQNYQKALDWYLKAAEKGDSKAMLHLGEMYSLGQGTPKNYEQSYKWLVLAAIDGGQNYITIRNGLEELLTPEQIAKGQELAAQWHQKFQGAKE